MPDSSIENLIAKNFKKNVKLTEKLRLIDRFEKKCHYLPLYFGSDISGRTSGAGSLKPSQLSARQRTEARTGRRHA